VYIRKLDSDENLFMGKAKEIVIHFPIISVKVDVELGLEKEFTRIDIIHSEKARVKLPIHYKT